MPSLPPGESSTSENLQLAKFTTGFTNWGAAMNANLDTIDAAVSALQEAVPPPQVNSDWNAASGVAAILNKPTIPTVPGNVSAFTNDAGYVTAVTAPVTKVAGRTGDVVLAESDITGLVSDLASKQPAIGFTPENAANKGSASGYPSLDSTGHIPLNQLPASVQGAMYFAGLWNASTNTPTISSGFGILGQYYKVSVAGSTSVDGNSTWHAGDWITFDGAAWDKIDNYEAVTTVAGRTGNITLTSSDVSGFAPVATSGSYADLSSKPTIPAVQVNSDWNAVSGLAQILNKPTLAPSATTDTTNATNITSGVLPVAQLPAFTSSAAGIVPASGGGSSNYLRADGSWSAPSGGGGAGSFTMTLSSALWATPTANQTNFFGFPGRGPAGNGSTSNVPYIKVPRNCTIKAVSYSIYISSASDTVDENFTFTVYKNTGSLSDTQGVISAKSVNGAVLVTGANDALAAGDKLLIQLVTPASWTTQPTNVYFYALVYCE